MRCGNPFPYNEFLHCYQVSRFRNGGGIPEGGISKRVPFSNPNRHTYWKNLEGAVLEVLEGNSVGVGIEKKVQNSIVSDAGKLLARI